MNLSDLWDTLKERINPGSTAVQTAPGQTYGPAVARVTRVPIQFSNNPNVEESGQYLAMPSGGFGAALNTIVKPHIVINPKSPDAQSTYGTNMGSVIKHEVAHSALEPVFNDPAYEKLASGNPYYARMYEALNKTREVNPAEVPAYAAEKDMTQYGIPSDLQQLYRNTLIKQLQAASPATASQYQKIVGSGR